VRIDMAARRQPWVALADISPSLGRAVMQAEDQRFMEHGGIDFKAVGQAAWDNLFRVRGSQARLRGASTITMQLAGLLDPALASRAAGTQLGPEMGPGARRARTGSRLEQAADPGSLPEPGELSRRAAGRRRGRARPVRQGAVQPGPG
jgi:hypothetical protein